MGAGASVPSDEIVDEELRAKVIKYEKKIVRHEAAGDDDVEEKRAKLKTFLDQEYARDSSRWARTPSWAAEAGGAREEAKEEQSAAHSEEKRDDDGSGAVDEFSREARGPRAFCARACFLFRVLRWRLSARARGLGGG